MTCIQNYGFQLSKDQIELIKFQSASIKFKNN